MSGNNGCAYDAGTAAGREYQSISGCSTPVPLEDDCGNFDHSCFIENGSPFSHVVAGSLEDLQYTVNYSALDGGTTLASSCACKRRDLEIQSDSANSGTRRLSTAGRAEATALGMEVLEERENNKDRALEAGVGYANQSGKVVVVLYREGGTLYSVVVRK